MADMGYGSGGGIGAPAGGVRLYPPVQVGDLLPPPATPTPAPTPYPLHFFLSQFISLSLLLFLITAGPPEWCCVLADRGREDSMNLHDSRPSLLILESYVSVDILECLKELNSIVSLSYIIDYFHIVMKVISLTLISFKLLHHEVY